MKRELILNVDGEEITVTAVRDGETILVERDGVEYPVRIVAESIVGMQAANNQPTGSAPAAAPRPAAPPPRNASAAGGNTRPVAETPSAGAVRAPMTGVIDQVLVAEGDTVAEGQNVVVLEAMKMYIDVAAPAGGSVSAISVKPGDSVKEGDPLLVIG